MPDRLDAHSRAKHKRSGAFVNSGHTHTRTTADDEMTDQVRFLPVAGPANNSEDGGGGELALYTHNTHRTDTNLIE